MRSWLTRFLIACIACAGAGLLPAAVPDTNQAAALRARYAALIGQLDRKLNRQPLYVESIESRREFQSEIHALVDYPFADIHAALNDPAHWCDILILQMNTRFCRTSTTNGSALLSVSLGNKSLQELNDAVRVDFAFSVAAATPDYLAVELNATTDRPGSSNPRIVLEAARVEGGRTILHLTYFHAYGWAAHFILRIYLATARRDEVGFTIVDTQPDGQPEFIGGLRGMIERDAVRYFIAIEAYLGALALPAPEQFEKRLQLWYVSTERYARQFHDVDRNAYFNMKRSEYLRQKSAQ